MDITLQVLFLFIIALPIASISWTITHEEVVREFREFCISESKVCKRICGRKFFYLFTCEYCLRHYVTVVFLVITRYKLLFPDWREYLICPSVVIMDGQSVKTTERGGTRGFDGYKRVKGRKRHILVDTLGLMIANRVEPANTSDRLSGARLLAGLAPLYPRIKTVIADAGHQSRRWARELMLQDGWKLLIVKRSQRAFKVTGFTWIVERTFAWLGRNRRFSKDYEYRVQTSETLLEIAATRLMLNRLEPA